MKPRYYQQDAVDGLFFAWDFYDRVLIHAGCGAGKTVIGGLSIKELLPNRCLWLGDSNELCSQPYRAICRIAGVIPGLEKSDSYAPLEAKVVVGSAQSLCNKERLKRFPRDHFQYIFEDEAHRGSDRTKAICDYFSSAKVCGFTATPFRSDAEDLSKYFEHVAYSMPMANLRDPLNSLIGMGFAPPWKILTLPVQIDMEGVKVGRTSEGREYAPAETEARIEPYYHEIAELYKKHAKKRHGVAFLPLKESSRNFAAICQEHGINAIHVAGDSPDRVEILERATRGEYDLVCNAGVLSTGVDIPIFDAFLCLRPVRSVAWYQQAAGRICRTIDGLINHLTEEDQADERKALIAASSKPDSLVLDVLWQHDMLGACHPGHLIAENEEEAKAIYAGSAKFKTERDLIEISEKILLAREKKLREELERAAEKAKKKMVPAELIGSLLNNPAILDYQPISLVEKAPPTDLQIETLTKRGIDCENLENRGLAQKILDELAYRSKYDMATPKQLRLMRRFHMHEEREGIPTVRELERLSFRAAGRLLDLEFRRKKEAPSSQTKKSDDFLL